VSSYAPLFVLCAFSQKDNIVLGGERILGFHELSLALLGLAFLGIISAVGIIYFTKQLPTTSIHTVKANTNNQDTISYLVTYIVPFIGLSFDSRASIVANTLLVIFIGVLYIQSNMIYLNPMLTILGYHLYRIEVAGAIDQKVLIARNLPKKSDRLDAVVLGNGVYLRHG
jgi:hypothetical protein